MKKKSEISELKTITNEFSGIKQSMDILSDIVAEFVESES